MDARYFEMIFKNIQTLITVSGAIRIALLIYGFVQDEVLQLKFTDIDYHVFNDAAHYLTHGQSPYQRDTYRYTPLLAFLLVPNHWIHVAWGKLVFVAADLAAGYVIYLYCLDQPRKKQSATACAGMWLLNPLTMTVSSRGNAESIMALLVLSTLYFVKIGHIWTSGVLYGLAVHFKIYPVIYSLPIYVYLASPLNTTAPRPRPKLHASLEVSFWRRLIPNSNHFRFGIAAAFSFLSLTLLFFYMFGYEFLHETYLYHLTRRDTRHNFSVYFLLLYLSSGTLGPMTGALLLLPQLGLSALMGCCVSDLALATLLQTIVFVAFNKVCTSQYFLWVLCLLPLVANGLRLSRARAMILALSWIAAQALWLGTAYLYEFRSTNSFLFMWISSLILFGTHVHITATLLTCYNS